MENNLNDYLTKDDVLRYFRISTPTYRRWRKQGLLKGERKGSYYLYHKNEIQALLKHLESTFTK